MLEAVTLPTYDAQKVLTKVDFSDDDTCWEWQGNIDKNGYGTYGKRNHMVHRVVYELLVDKLGAEDSIDHLCLNRCCVNPNHLEVVSLSENILRGGNPYAVNARKTVCGKGHEFNDNNTYIHPKRGHRQCKICRNEATRRYQLRKTGY